MRSVDEIADELYSLPPSEFTAARDVAVAGARTGGDRETAKRLAALKRPTQGAHLVNLLALRRPEVVADLLTLGEQIRAAQGSVSAAELRNLSTHRRAAIGAALRLCRTLAGEAGSGEPTAAQLDEAEATLAAAMADESAADLVRAGRVVKALSYAGFGAGFAQLAERTSSRPSGGPRPPAHGQTVRAKADTATVAPEPAFGEGEPGADPDAVRRDDVPDGSLGGGVRAAWQRLARAEASLAVAQEQERAANEEMDRTADEITRLRAALDAAAKRARTARTARQAAERELASARREVDTGA